MSKDFVTFNPQRDYLLQRLLELRQDHPDTFAEAWAVSGEIFKDWSKLNIENPGFEFICFSFRMWLMQAKLMPPTLHHMGPTVKGMILVDMERLGEPPPSLWSLVTGEDESDFLENDDK